MNKPAVLKDTRKTKKITLPKLGGEVEIYQGLLTGDIEDLVEQGLERSPSAIVGRIIKDWDLVDENGNKVPATRGNIRLLEAEDLMHIIQQAELDGDFLEQAGKASKGN